MTFVIIETNVAVVANGQNLDVVESCIDACKMFLIRAMRDHVTLLDANEEILHEYLGAISRQKPHGLGARFLIEALRQRYNEDRFRQIDLPKTDSGEFVDFPDDPQLANFDPSDRKFVALAQRTGTAVTNAIDSDWTNFIASLRANGIEVTFLCGCDPDNWFIANQ